MTMSTCNYIEMPPAMILCGGQGTRLRDVTELLPKPMVPVGSQPILWHIMKSYAAFGVKRFILCLGYKREAFIEYFLNYHARATDITIKLGSDNRITYHGSNGEEDWEVTLVDTGEASMTGCRVFRAGKYLKEGDRNFFLTYGDAVADIDIGQLYQTHLKEDKKITITAVHPCGRFGELSICGGQVQKFHEKPQTESGFINGGFMVMRKDFISSYLCDDAKLVLELDPMRNAVRDGEMSAFEHCGFWQCMDTAREHGLLNELWSGGRAEWTKYWRQNNHVQ